MLLLLITEAEKWFVDEVMQKDDRVPLAGTKVDSSTSDQDMQSSSDNAKLNVVCSLVFRRNR